MPEPVIEQAIVIHSGASGAILRARSAGFAESWLAAAEQTCTTFGERPSGAPCPECVFARPLGRHQIAVVSVADQTGDSNSPTLAFRFLVLPRPTYRQLGADPFHLARQFPPTWNTRGDLPALIAPARPPPRTVADIRPVLQRTDGPALLGATQALVDGGRVVFQRPDRADDLIASLWLLLPTSTRSELWPASFAYTNALRFDILVVPDAAGETFVGYLSEEQAESYPEGRYELALQTAAEAGDQAVLDRLFARRSGTETWRLGLTLVAAAVLLALAMRLLNSQPAPHLPAENTGARTTPKRSVWFLPPLRGRVRMGYLIPTTEGEPHAKAMLQPSLRDSEQPMSDWVSQD